MGYNNLITSHTILILKVHLAMLVFFFTHPHMKIPPKDLFKRLVKLTFCSFCSRWCFGRPNTSVRVDTWPYNNWFGFGFLLSFQGRLVPFHAPFEVFILFIWYEKEKMEKHYQRLAICLMTRCAITKEETELTKNDLHASRKLGPGRSISYVFSLFLSIFFQTC